MTPDSVHIQVENHNVAFSPPRKSLHQHIEDMRQEKSGVDVGPSVDDAAFQEGELEKREE